MSLTDKIRKRTFIQKLACNAWFHRSAKGTSTYKFEIFCRVVHLLSLQVRDDDVDIIAAMIVHAPEEHQLRQLAQQA
jgi:hypothetical protein